MNLIDDGYCFVCGKNNDHGLKLSFTSSQGRTVSEFVVQSRFQGYKDIVHGGVITAILDEAMIYAAMAEGLSPVTAEITVRFRQPLVANRQAVVEAELVDQGPRIVKVRSRISDKTSGAVIAEATAKLLPLKKNSL